MYMYIYIYTHMNSINIIPLIRRPLPELEHVNLHLPSINSFQSCRLRSAITAIPCNPTFCRLQSTYTAKCRFPHCFILQG